MEAKVITNDFQPTTKRQQVYVWVRQHDVVDAAADWFQSFSSRLFTQSSEPVHLSSDDEHMWIGLAP